MPTEHMTSIERAREIVAVHKGRIREGYGLTSEEDYIKLIAVHIDFAIEDYIRRNK